MGRIDVNLPDKLEEEFRNEVAKELGMRRGNLSIALQEGIKLWIETHRQKRSEAANKAWKTRRVKKEDEADKLLMEAKKRKRSEAANKAWKTRRVKKEDEANKLLMEAKKRKRSEAANKAWVTRNGKKAATE